MHVAAKYIFIILIEKQIFRCNLEVLYQGTKKKKILLAMMKTKELLNFACYKSFFKIIICSKVATIEFLSDTNQGYNFKKKRSRRRMMFGSSKHIFFLSWNVHFWNEWIDVQFLDATNILLQKLQQLLENKFAYSKRGIAFCYCKCSIAGCKMI